MNIYIISPHLQPYPHLRLFKTQKSEKEKGRVSLFTVRRSTVKRTLLVKKYTGGEVQDRVASFNIAAIIRETLPYQLSSVQDVRYVAYFDTADFIVTTVVF